MSQEQSIQNLSSGLAEDLRAAVDAAVESLLSSGRISSTVYPELSANGIRRDSSQPLAKAIDHTLLAQKAAAADYDKLCTDAAAWDVWSVCIPPARVAQAAAALEHSTVQVCTVIGFPFGYAVPEAKAREVQMAIADGADELDMVIQVGLANDGDWPAVFDDIAIVVAESGSRIVKVILESGELGPERTAAVSAIACLAGASFLKTSTGFAANGAGADIASLSIMRQLAGSKRGVKASGGVRDAKFAQDCLAAGADRIGASSTAKILGLGASAGAY